MSHDLVIVGGGIVGASAALFASETNASVLLLDSPETSGRASSAAAGLLEPPHFVDRTEELSDVDPFAALGETSYRFYPEFLDRLGKMVPGTPEWNEPGGLKLATDERQMEDLRTYAGEMERHGQPVEVLSASDCRERVDVLSARITGGLLLSREARIHPARLLDSLHRGLTEASGVERREVHVDRIERRNGTVELHHGEDVIRAGRMLLAAGAWTQDLIPDNCRFPHRIEPRSGEMVRLDPEGGSFEPTLHGAGKHLFVREGALVVGATVVREGRIDRVRRETRRELTQVASRFLREERSVEDIRQSWVGHRPWINRKGGPYLGPVDDDRTIWVAAGHYRSGILMGPCSARLVMDGLLDREGDLPVTYRRYC